MLSQILNTKNQIPFIQQRIQKFKIMQAKSIGFLLIVLGIAMMAYTGFNYVTTKKVVDIGPIQIDKKQNHFVEWSPIVGIVLLIGGVVIIVRGSKATT